VYGIIGEHPTDVDTLKVLVKKIAKNNAVKVHVKGYGGAGQLFRKGAKQLTQFSGAPHYCQRFIVCYDSDGNDPKERHRAVANKIIKPSKVKNPCCILIPVQELEAWILADIQAVQNVITSWAPKEITNPEAISKPKEHLEKLSRASNKRPRYDHTLHNDKVAAYLDLAKVAAKCVSFRPLINFVERGIPNHP